MADQNIPLKLSIAPFPEGFQGDMDETFQQACILMEATVEGQFLTGLVLPPGSTLPSTDVGAIFMGGVWYYWDPVTGQYQPQNVSSKVAKNVAKNCIYQVRQTGDSFTLGNGVTQIFDLALARTTGAGTLTAASVPSDSVPATADNDFCQSCVRYMVGGTVIASPSATALFVHEHLVEGSELNPLQGQTLSLSFSAWTNAPGIYSIYLTSSGRDESYVVNFAMPTANTWTRIKIGAIPAIPATGTWSFAEGTTGMYIGFAMCVGSQWKTTTPNTWVNAFMAGTATNDNLCTVTNNQLKISGVKLEASSYPTYLQVPSFDSDFWECIRYYWTSYNYQSTTAGAFSLNIIAPINGFGSGSMPFPRRMAKVPTLTTYSPSTNAINRLLNITQAVDVTAFAAPVGFNKGITFNGAITTPASVKGDVIAAIITADARLT